jgi:hypothetical protein
MQTHLPKETQTHAPLTLSADISDHYTSPTPSINQLYTSKPKTNSQFKNKGKLKQEDLEEIKLLYAQRDLSSQSEEEPEEELSNSLESISSSSYEASVSSDENDYDDTVTYLRGPTRTMTNKFNNIEDVEYNQPETNPSKFHRQI